MTMVIGSSTYWFALMVSDRLVTLQRPGGSFAGNHDIAANKTVVFLTEDAVVTLGYTGSAYLASLPTDQWIAQSLWGAPIEATRSGEFPTIRRGPRPGPRGLNRSLLELRRDLASVPGGDQVTVLGTGWRSRRGRFVPILFEFGAWNADGRARGPVLRGPRDGMLRQAVVGMRPPQQIIEAANRDRPPVADAPALAARQTDIFTDIIRRTSRVNPTVGPHVMTVTIPRPPFNRVTAQFRPDRIHHVLLREPPKSAAIPIAFSPWVVTDVGFNAASILAGMSMSYPMMGWTFEMVGQTESHPDGASHFMMEQSRKPMPGHRPERR